MRRILVSLIAGAVAALGVVALSAGSARVSTQKPASPRTVRGAPGSGRAVVSWQRPLQNGGAPIDSYEVVTYFHEMARPINVFHSTKTAQTILSLTNGKSYTFRVAAHNTAGWSRLSAESPAVVVGVPSPPSDLRVVTGNAKVKVSWTAPSVTNGSKVTAYRVTPHLGAKTLTAIVFNSTATMHTITGLANGKTYSFQVAAHNGRGWSSPSPESADVVVGAPAAPTHVTGVPGHLRATVSWTAPSTDNGAGIGAYRVTPYLGSVAKPAQTFDATATSRAVTGLTKGKGYRFRVEAHNARGWSVHSARSSVVTPS